MLGRRITSLVLPLAAPSLSLLVACTSLTTQAKQDIANNIPRRSSPSSVSHFSDAAHGWMGLSFLQWGGTLVGLFGLVACVLSLLPATKLLFSLRTGLVCILIGVCSIFLYDILTELKWIIYVLLGIGLVSAFLAYLPSLVHTCKRAREYWTRTDDDHDGTIGFNPPLCKPDPHAVTPTPIKRKHRRKP